MKMLVWEIKIEKSTNALIDTGIEYSRDFNIWVVLQKLPQLSDTHFSKVLNKLEKIFFHGFIKDHLEFKKKNTC